MMIKRKFKLAICCKCGKRDPEGRHIPADATDVTCFACVQKEHRQSKPDKFTGRKPQ